MGRVSCFLCIQAMLSSFAVFTHAVPAQIVIVPSAEQAFGSLTVKGLERAQALSPYLSQTSFLIGPGVFKSIFATRPNLANSSLASTQTLAPLGFSLSLPVHSPYGVGQENLLATLILEDERYDGMNVMISWEIENVPTLITALGYTPTINPISINRSDLTFVLPYPITSPNPTNLVQELLFGDSSILP